MKVRSAILAFSCLLGLQLAASALDEVDKLEMRAQAAFEAKDYDLAIRCFTEAIKLSPNEAAPYVNRAAVDAAKGDADKQLADYAEAIRVDPDDPSSYQMRAQLYRDKLAAVLKGGTARDDEDTDKALADYEQMMHIQLDGVPDPKAAAREAAVKPTKEINYLLACACWSAAIKADPKDATAWFRRAVFDELLLRPDKALADCNEALRLDPKNTDARALRAQIDAGWQWESDSHPFNQRDKHAAAGEYDKAIADCNLLIWLGRGDIWESYAQRGQAYLAEGKWENAVADYTEAIRIGPVEMQDGNYDDRGRAYMQGGEYDKAAADFTAAAAAWRKEMTREYSETPGGMTKSAAEADNAIASQFLIRCAEAYMRGHKYDKAIEVLENNIKIDHSDTWSMDALAWLYATCFDAKFRNGAGAVKLAKRAGVGDPYYDDTMAAACAEAGQWDEAVKFEKQAIHGDDDNADYAARLKLYEQKKPYRGVKEFEVGD